MNPKSATAILGVAILVGGELALEHSDSLVPRQHVHPEIRTGPVYATAASLSASGGQGAFDNEAFSPALPWARWWRADEGAMPAVQGMLTRLDV